MKQVIAMLIVITSSFLMQSAYAVDCSAVAAWSSNTTYFGGELVQYQNTRFKAAHWTSGNTPDSSNPWGPWREPTACTGSGSSGGSSSGGTSSGGSSSGGSSSGGSSSGGSSSGGCPQYVAGTSYSTGDVVQNGGSNYTCSVAGWCSSLNAASAYAPGTGSAWTSAWTAGGTCGGGSSSSGGSSGGTSSGGSSSGGSSGAGFEACTIDVSNVGATCSGNDPSTCDGTDIAQNYALWPDPYQCYVCGPGVTLLQGSRCELNGVNLVWNSTNEQCILNGQGYPMAASHSCSNGHYTDGITPAAYDALVSDWHRIATTIGTPVFQPNAGADAHVVNVTLENGQQVQAAMSMGHGTLDGKCGSTFLIKRGSQYVLLLQTDVRSWSLELSPGANTWLDESNVGGTCIIPDVRKIDASFVIGQF